METGPQPSNRLSLFLLIFLLAFVALALHCSAGPWWKDSGELAAAFLAGSIAHPGGFSANAMLAALVAQLPLGSLHHGLALFSALCAALAAGFLGLLIAGSIASPWARPLGLLGALGFLLTRTVWIHSVSVEVYAPSVALAAFGLWNCVGYLEGPGGGLRLRGLRETSLLLGLSLGFHITSTMVLGLCLLALLAAPGRPRFDARGLASALGLALLGSLVCLYLPLRYATNPPHPFAAVDGLSTLWAHLSGSSIRGAFGKTMLDFSPLALADNARLYWSQTWDQCGLALPLALGWLLWLAVAGRRRPGDTWSQILLVALLLADGAFSILLNPMGQPEFQTGLLSRFALFALAGRGLLVLLASASRWRLRLPALALSGLVVLLALLLPLGPATSLPLVERHPGLMQDRGGPADPLLVSPCRHLEAPSLYLERLWAEPPEALALTGLDDASSLGIFGQGVEGRRPDLLLVVKQFLGDPALQVAARETHGQFFPQDQVQGPAALRSLLGLALAQGRTVLWQRGQEAQEGLRSGLGWVDSFPLERLVPRAELECAQSPPVPLWLISCRPDQLGATVWSQDFSLAGVCYLEDCGEAGLQQAAGQFGRAVEMDPRNCKAWNNLAAFYGRSNQAQPALAATLRAVTVCPRNPAARVNELRYLYLTGNPEGARIRAPLLLDQVSDPQKARGMLMRLAGQLRGGGLEEDAQFLELLTK
jgi:hypothetical protein